MNKFEKIIYKDSKYMRRHKEYTEFCRLKKEIFEEYIKIFKIREILDWLNKIAIRIGL